MLAGVRGNEPAASELISGVITQATKAGQGTAVQYAWWARAVLMNGLGRYDEAFADAVEASEQTPELFIASWASVELIEAATRSGRDAEAGEALDRLAGHIEGCESDWALGVHARSCALLRQGDAAESLYREAIDRLSRTRPRPELARAHLLYGEWLRREVRRVDARVHLRTAHDMLASIGMEAFAERARRELLATGENVRARTVETPDLLTAQESLVAHMASDGLTNLEIGARLFLSARTVEWHLGKVFAKLGVSSRRELNAILPKAELAAVPAS
ncbi:helix-turn-helix domain-containing protein [Nocardioides halotolerans]|uniref:helix-turn-helix domain-containing protein n=1 Tax=Nocardioides halotolerans TaxID=433660 RepID=UPI000420704A|nr:helix-turn-helix transcriptional regulator [Nocardioides halotolerans]